MKAPDQQRITEEIAALAALKPKVRRQSQFGDDHHAAIDAQIRVLQDGLSEDEIYDEFTDPDDEEAGRNVLDAALDARFWLDGDWDEGDHEGDSPVADWKSLAR
jgi:hypothetical protein